MAILEELKHLSSNGQYVDTTAAVATLVRERGEKLNIRIYDALILANADAFHGSAAEVRGLLQEMIDEGVTPDAATYHKILKVLAVHPDYLFRQHVIDQLRNRWFSLTNDGCHFIAAALIRERQLERALESLEHMQKEGIKVQAWLYDMMIYALCSAEEFDEALRLMQYRLAAGELLISGTVWFHLLDTASRALHFQATLVAYNARVETNYLNPPSGVCLNVLSTATRHGNTRLATSVLRVLSKRSGNPIQLHHYEALLETYVRNDDLYTAFTILTTMATAGFAPCEGSTRPIFAHLRQSPRLPGIAQKILKDLKGNHRQIPIQAVNVVIEAHVFHQDLDSALKLYSSMQSFSISAELVPNTATYNSLFNGCAKAARKDKAMFLASEMVALNINPDALSYDRLIGVCLSYGAGLGDAWKYFEEMRQAGWWTRKGTTIRLAKAACAAGDSRIWKLLDEQEGVGFQKTTLERMVEDKWLGEAQAGLKEVERARRQALESPSAAQGRAAG